MGGAVAVAGDGTAWVPSASCCAWVLQSQADIVPIAVASVSIIGNTLAVDAAGASRFGGFGAWEDLGLAPLGFAARGVAGVGPVDHRFIAVGPSGQVRVALSGPWQDPLAGGVLDIEPIGVTNGGTGVVAPEDWLVVGVNGEVRRGSLDGTTWIDPMAGGTIGIAPVGVSGAIGGHMAVDAAGNVRASPDNGASWSTPAGSPIT
jgi:hypothetical protein